MYMYIYINTYMYIYTYIYTYMRTSPRNPPAWVPAFPEPTPLATRGFGAINPPNPRVFGVSFSGVLLADGPRFWVF